MLQHTKAKCYADKGLAMCISYRCIFSWWIKCNVSNWKSFRQLKGAVRHLTKSMIILDAPKNKFYFSMDLSRGDRLKGVILDFVTCHVSSLAISLPASPHMSLLPLTLTSTWLHRNGQIDSFLRARIHADLSILEGEGALCCARFGCLPSFFF